MIIKQRKFKLSPGTLYGFAGGAFGLLTVGLMINAQMAPETFASCTERYGQAGIFALERSTGALLEPAELQSRLGGQEWGVLQNIAVEPDKSAARKVAMSVRFNEGAFADFAQRNVPSGVGFKWQPSYLKKASAACLSYSVYIPRNFKFANGGTLPGLYGTSSVGGSDKKKQFSARMRWLEAGKIGVQPVTPKLDKGHLIVLSEQWLKLPRDQWVEIEQEVVLNSPGRADGHLRIWIDGRLQLNKGEIAFRRNATDKFDGVIADTHYSNKHMEWTPAPKASEIKLSPMVVRWN